MPTVRRYGTPQVATTPLPRARRTAAETAESKGAAVERARGERGELIGTIGANVANRSIAKYAEIRERERQRADRIAVLSATNTLVRTADTYLADGLGRTLKNAIGVTAEVEARIKEDAAKIRQGLATDAQRDAFDETLMERGVQWKRSLETHERNQISDLHRTELIQWVKHQAEEAVGYYKDPPGVRDSLKSAENILRDSAADLGIDEFTLHNQIAALRSSVHVGIVEAHMADGNDIAAKDWFDEAYAGGQILADDATKLKAKLEVKSTDGLGMRTAESIWKDLGPQGDADPIHLDKMEALAMKLLPDQPNAIKATIDWLRTKKAGVDAARADRKEATIGKLWSAVAEKRTLSEIQAMPEYLATDGQTRERVTAYTVQRAEQDADRRYTLNERARAARERVEREREAKEMAAMWSKADPLMVAAMTENQILGLMPDIGVENVRSLLAKKATLKDDKTVREAKIDDDLFKNIAEGAGLNPYRTQMSESEKATLGTLRNQVETEINARQEAEKRTLSRGEKEKIMRDIVDRRVIVDNYFGDDTKVASLVVNATDKQRAFVPLANIPRTHQDDVVRIIQTLHPTAQHKTREQILSEYKERIQRAYAAELLGLGADEIKRRLQGQ